jgi:hypothetical protein
MIKIFSEFLNEVLTHKDFELTSDTNTIIAKDKYIYFFDKNNEKDVVNIINELDIENIINKLDIEDSIGLSVFYNLIEEILINHLNILLFHIENNNTISEYENSNEFKQDYRLSNFFINILKKLQFYNFKYLIVKTASFDEDYSVNDYEVDIDIVIKNFEEDLKYRKLPKIIYHGTCSYYLQNILKIGLKNNNDKSNFQNVYRQNKYVFLTSNFETAKFYAENSANKTNSFPIILAIDSSKLDINLISFDYDFYKTYIGHGHEYFDEINSRFRQNCNFNLSYLHDKYIGATYLKFSYGGRISPFNIKEIYYKSSYDIHNFDEYVTRDDFKLLINMFNFYNDNYGYDYSEYYLNMDDYLNYDEENENNDDED